MRGLENREKRRERDIENGSLSMCFKSRKELIKEIKIFIENKITSRENIEVNLNKKLCGYNPGSNWTNVTTASCVIVTGKSFTV